MVLNREMNPAQRRLVGEDGGLGERLGSDLEKPSTVGQSRFFKTQGDLRRPFGLVKMIKQWRMLLPNPEI